MRYGRASSVAPAPPPDEAGDSDNRTDVAGPWLAIFDVVALLQNSPHDPRHHEPRSSYRSMPHRSSGLRLLHSSVPKTALAINRSKRRMSMPFCRLTLT